MAPASARWNSGRLRSMRATASPGSTPSAARPAAMRSTWPAYCAQVISVAPPGVRSATRSGWRAAVAWKASHRLPRSPMRPTLSEGVGCAAMARERDLFADFARMRRDMDQLFGGGLERPVPDARRRAGFSPPVDVYYMGEPPRAVVRAELAGIDPDTIALEIQGRELVLAGHRRSAAAAEGRAYQQVEIPHGPFRRVVSLGADVRPEQARAVYEDGILRIELPLAQPDSRPRTVPVQTPRP